MIGAAWGASIRAVEVKIDDGEWMPTSLDTSQQADYARAFWSLDWSNPTSGEHAITSHWQYQDSFRRANPPINRMVDTTATFG